MGLDLDSRDDGLHIAPVVEQRSQAGPALLAHAVSLVNDGDPAADHGGHQRRRDVSQTVFPGDHGRNQQVFGARVHGGLQNIDVASHALTGGIGEGSLADTRFAQKPRIHRQILFVYHHPRGQQLPHELVLSNPLHRQLIGMCQMQGYPLDVDRHTLFPIIGFSGLTCSTSIARTGPGCPDGVALGSHFSHRFGVSRARRVSAGKGMSDPG